MSRGYTADEVFEARDCGEPVMITRDQVEKFFAEHDMERADRDEFFERFMPDGLAMIDAAEAMAWQGY